MDQIRRYNPPPNPAKPNDSRDRAYSRRYGTESWELDALEPDVLIGLVESNIRRNLDEALWESERARQESEREVLKLASRNWPTVTGYLRRKRGQGELP